MRRTLFADEHELFRETVRSFVDKEITPQLRDLGARRHRAPGALPGRRRASASWPSAAPEDYGGGGVDDFRYNLILSEEMQRAGVAGSGLALTLHNDICLPYFLHLADDEQKARWLPGICSGELITAVAMTEPGMGSDLASMKTTAIRDGDTYVVNGSKTFITNGINADLVIIAVKTDPTQRHKGMSLLVLERGMPGFERGRNLDKIGLHAQDTAELFFADVAVPGGQPAGRPRARASSTWCSNLPQERLSIAVSGQAAARQALELDARLLRGARGVRPADRVVPEQPLLAGRDGHRDRDHPDLRRPVRDRAQRRRAHRRGGGHGQVVGHRAAEARPSTGASSCTAATATCSSTRSPGPTWTPGSRPSTAARPRS